ncbi:MAG: UDP-2,3-diacylglucosamine diphosphatase [Betaproteobacteria bacterium]
MLHFVSDLHLSPHSPGATRLFLDYLAGRAQQARSLYILGDLFETWIGDDDDDPFQREIVGALKAVSDAGLGILIQHGNRDFLLGEGFAASSGCRLLSDPYVLSLPSWQFVLTHGDALCTDDAEYMSFRHQVRSPEWQAAFLAKPLAERRAIAAYLRNRSEMNKQEKTAALMDVNPQETDDFIRQHGYATLIHGHTHRPATHDHFVDGIHVERWVLSDWHEDRGEFLAWDGDTLQRRLLT